MAKNGLMVELHEDRRHTARDHSVENVITVEVLVIRPLNALLLLRRVLIQEEPGRLAGRSSAVLAATADNLGIVLLNAPRRSYVITVDKVVIYSKNVPLNLFVETARRVVILHVTVLVRLFAIAVTIPGI